eukprot:scaffold248524_cov122-Cyclotella_meneghiniana.AAC.1
MNHMCRGLVKVGREVAELDGQVGHFSDDLAEWRGFIRSLIGVRDASQVGGSQGLNLVQEGMDALAEIMVFLLTKVSTIRWKLYSDAKDPSMLQKLNTQRNEKLMNKPIGSLHKNKICALEEGSRH